MPKNDDISNTSNSKNIDHVKDDEDVWYITIDEINR